MWTDIDKKAEAILQSAECKLRDSETVKAELEPPWDGEHLVLLLLGIMITAALCCCTQLLA
jgi:hypothetical protein